MTEEALSVGRPLGLGHLEGPVPAGAESDGLEEVHRPGHLLGDGGGGACEEIQRMSMCETAPAYFKKNEREGIANTSIIKVFLCRGKPQ